VAPNGRKKGDDTLILALASGATAAGAAEVAKLSVRTVYRRLQDPEFRRRVDAEREALITRTVGRLSALGVLASETLERLLGATSDNVRLGAARAVLEHLFRGNEVFVLARQLSWGLRLLFRVVGGGVRGRVPVVLPPPRTRGR
jgi:hypothetical protein